MICGNALVVALPLTKLPTSCHATFPKSAPRLCNLGCSGGLVTAVATIIPRMPMPTCDNLAAPREGRATEPGGEAHSAVGASCQEPAAYALAAPD